MGALYLVALAAASGLAGVFARRVLDEFGFIADFETGLMLAGGVASAYAAVQLAWLALIKLLNPTRNPGVYLLELLGQCVAGLFIPYLLRLEIPWPHEALDRVAPLVFLGAFIAVHAVLKLAAFFASLQGEDASPIGFLGWLAAACVTGYFGVTTLLDWGEDSVRAMPRAPEETAPYRSGDTYAVARLMAEGSLWDKTLNAQPDTALTIRFAVPPEGTGATEPISRVWVSVTFDNDIRGSYLATEPLVANGWTEVRIPQDAVPDGAESYSVRWTREEDPTWQRLLGLRPIVYGERDPQTGLVSKTASLLMSGPFEHHARPEAEGPSFLVISIDGLTAQHVSLFGYEPETTPSLDRLGYRALAFPNTFTPAPETPGAVMSLLTGLSPLRHGHLSGHANSLPDGYQTIAEPLRDAGYTTAAFTEGEGPGSSDLVYRTGIERGFELFDVEYAVSESTSGDESTPSGSAATLERVRSWIDSNQELKFFAFARLRDLVNFEADPPLGTTFFPEDGAPTREQRYDSALAYLDRHLGALIKFIRDNETRRDTAIIITGAYGADLAAADPFAPSLAEPVLNVPLIVYSPDIPKTPRSDMVTLEDVAPTLARMASIDLPRTILGKALINTPSGNRPVSMMGRPLSVSLRTGDYRYTWRSGVYGFEDRLPEPDAPVGLYRVRDSSAWWTQDVSQRYTREREQMQAELRRYIDQHRRVAPQP